MSEETLSKALLEKLISENSERIAFEVNEKGTSELWKLFYLVKVDGLRKEYACCSMCSCVVAHSQRTGTGSLLRHKCAQFVRENLHDKPKTHGEMGLKPDSVPKAVVEQLIGEHSNRITFEANEKGTSHLWQIFKLVTVDGKREPYACCSMCGAVVVYSVKTGTGSLLRHKCSQFVEDTTPSRRKSVKKFAGAVSKSVLCEKRQELLAFKALKYISKDLHPFKVIADPGFRELAQALIDFGADFGKMPVDDVFAGLSESSIAQTHIPRMYQDIKQRIAVLFCASDCMAFSTNLWTDIYQKRFISLTAHLITEDFELHRLALGTRELGEMKSTNIILETIISIIAQYTGDIPSAVEKMKFSVFVTGNDVEIVATFGAPLSAKGIPEEKNGTVYKMLKCGCNAINLALNEVLENKIDEVYGLEELLNDCSELVMYFKKTGLNCKLSQPLTYEGETKWHSVHNMIERILDNYDTIHGILDERDELHMMDTIELDVLKGLQHFLERFKQCCESLRTDRRPTIQEYSLWNLKLKKHCDASISESRMIQEIKVLTSKILEFQFKADTLHNVALLLNPSFKSLRVLPPADKIQATAAVIELINAEEKKNANEKSDPLLSESNDVEEPPMKIYRRDETPGEFDEFMDICNENSTESSDELNRYLEKRVNQVQQTPDKSTSDKSRHLDNQDDVIEFWKNHRIEFPSLSKVARRILAIPASAAAGDRAGRILEERRAPLSPDYMDQVLFLHHNL